MEKKLLFTVLLLAGYFQVSAQFECQNPDNDPPIAICNEDLIINVGGSGQNCITASDIDENSWDACGITSMQLDKSCFTCSEAGIVEVTLTVFDAAGNANSCTTIVEVNTNETTSPTLSCPPSIVLTDMDQSGSETISAADLILLYGFQASDNCTNPPALTITPSSFAANTTTQATVTATDAAGNKSTCPVLVTVNPPFNPVCLDTTLSVVTGCTKILLGEEAIEGPLGNYSYSDFTITVQDGDPNNGPIVDGLGTFDFTVVLPAANFSCSGTVTTVDTEAPALSCPGLIELVDLSPYGEEAVDPADLVSVYGFQATDNCMGPVSWDIVPSVFPANVNTTATVIATDAANNSNSCTVDVIFPPCSTPEFTGLGVEHRSDRPGDPELGGGYLQFFWNNIGADDLCKLFIKRLTGPPNTGDPLTKWKTKSLLSSEFSSPPVPITATLAPDYFFLAGEDYEFRVRCSCNSGNVGWSPYYQFTFQSIDGPLLRAPTTNEENARLSDLPTDEWASAFQKEDFWVKPNPATDLLHLFFETAPTSRRQLRLIDLNGRVLKEQTIGVGEYDMELKVNELPRGMYLLQIRDGETSRLRKIILK